MIDLRRMAQARQEAFVAGRRRYGMGLTGVDRPLAFVVIDGERKLVVSPWAAFGTDAVGLALAGGLFIAADSVWLKLLAGIGAAWMSVAFIRELSKLIEGPERVVSTTEAV